MSDRKKAPPGGATDADFLLADIDSSSLEEVMRRRALEEQEAIAMRALSSSLSFPVLTPMAGDKTDSPTPQAAQRSGPMQPTPPSGGPGSLLGSLRQKAMVLQQSEAKDAKYRDAISVRMDYALRQVFSYLNELVQLLNQLKPEIPKEYLLGSDVFKDMSWLEGFCDYRTQAEQGGTLMASVGFSYHLASPKVIKFEREGGQVDKFRASLYDNGIPFNCEEFRNERHYVERAVFKVPTEVRVHVDWVADYDRGLLVVNARNLGRFGVNEYLLKPASVTEALLEEFSNMVMGSQNRFPSMVRAQAPQAGSLKPKG